MPLRKADVGKTRRFEDGEDWIELRLELTKSQRDAVNDATSLLRAGMTGPEVVQQTAVANRRLFHYLAVDWSLDGTPDGDAYAALDEESGAWVDDCIAKVLEERRERAEKNSSSSAKPRRRGTSSPTAAG